MIVYVKNKSGEIYASPVFAEVNKGWNIKSVVLDETGRYLILLPLLKNKLLSNGYNYFYIDETLQEGWSDKSKAVRGFKDIIENKEMLKELKHGKKVSIKDLNCSKLYNLPLPVINDFNVQTEQDIKTFYTVCWGLHDAYIDKIEEKAKNIVVNFDTTWGKHIIMTFLDVIEAKNLNDLGCIFDSTFKIEENQVKWEVVDGFDAAWNGLSENQVYVVARKISWKLVID